MIINPVRHIRQPRKLITIIRFRCIIIIILYRPIIFFTFVCPAIQPGKIILLMSERNRTCFRIHRCIPNRNSTRGISRTFSSRSSIGIIAKSHTLRRRNDIPHADSYRILTTRLIVTPEGSRFFSHGSIPITHRRRIRSVGTITIANRRRIIADGIVSTSINRRSIAIIPILIPDRRRSRVCYFILCPNSNRLRTGQRIIVTDRCRLLTIHNIRTAKDRRLLARRLRTGAHSQSALTAGLRLGTQRERAIRPLRHILDTDLLRSIDGDCVTTRISRLRQRLGNRVVHRPAIDETLVARSHFTVTCDGDLDFRRITSAVVVLQLHTLRSIGIRTRHLVSAVLRRDQLPIRRHIGIHRTGRHMHNLPLQSRAADRNRILILRCRAVSDHNRTICHRRDIRAEDQRIVRRDGVSPAEDIRIVSF